MIVPLSILGFLYILILDNKSLPPWMETISDKSRNIWTYGIITITIMSILKYLSGN